MATIPTIDYVLQFKLWSKVRIENPTKFYDSCWLFEGQRSTFGHGSFKHHGVTYHTHRLSYMLAHGLRELPAEVVIRHKCDVPNCVNPLHLETGSKEDNDMDRDARGRTLRGVTHGMSLFTDATQVREIRWLYAQVNGKRGACTAIGKRYHVSKTVVRYICIRDTWKDLADDFDTLDPKPVPLTPEEMCHRPDNHGSSKLTELTIQRIRACRKMGATLSWISSKFDRLSEGAISDICNRNSWKDVAEAAPVDVLAEDELQIIETLYPCPFSRTLH